jgi:hypothetical protein
MTAIARRPSAQEPAGWMTVRAVRDGGPAATRPRVGQLGWATNPRHPRLVAEPPLLGQADRAAGRSRGRRLRRAPIAGLIRFPRAAIDLLLHSAWAGGSRSTARVRVIVPSSSTSSPAVPSASPSVIESVVATTPPLAVTSSLMLVKRAAALGSSKSSGLRWTSASIHAFPTRCWIGAALTASDSTAATSFSTT